MTPDRLSAVNDALADAEVALNSSSGQSPSAAQTPALRPSINSEFVANSRSQFGMDDRKEKEIKPAEPQRASYERRHRNEVALQVASYLFESEDKWLVYDDNSEKTKKSGSLIGIYGAHTWSLYEPLRSWSDIWAKNPLPNFVRVEGEVSKGRIDYESSVAERKEGISALELEVRLLLGYDYLWSDKGLLTPYIGLGYRRFSDRAGGWVDYYVNNYAPYTVENSIYYLPFGLEALTHLDGQWDMNLKFEGDWVFGGSINYCLNDISGLFPGVDAQTGEALTLRPGANQSRLKSGYGFQTSVKFIRKGVKLDFFVEPYFKLWSLRKSNPVQVHSYAVNNNKEYVSVYPDKVTPYKPLWDPDNYTVNTGLRVGVMF